MVGFSTSLAWQEDENLLQDASMAEFDIEVEDELPTSRSSQRIQLPGVRVVFLQTMAFIRSIYWLDALRILGRFLKPSFLQSSEASARTRPAKLYPTAFLDGMRGIAAFTVMIAHWSGWIYDNQLGWGAKGGYYDFLRLPIFCLFYHGSIQVDIFFVISGYVLSCRPIRFIRRGQVTEFHGLLTSLLLRRWARLFLPIAASTLMIAFLLQLGAYDAVRGFHEDKKYMTHRIEVHVKPQPTFFGELWHWLGQQWLITRGAISGKVVDRSGLQYDSHMWTIPIEFKCSLYLFLTLLGTSRLQVFFRFCLVFVVMVHSWHRGTWDLVLFLSGMVIAECDDIRGAHELSSPLPQIKTSSMGRSKCWNNFWIVMSIVALFLLSQPEVECRQTPGWHTLCQTIPSWWGAKGAGFVYQRTGAILWVASVSRVSFLQRLYETKVVQYLGKISYSIYLVHGMMNHTIGLFLEMIIFKYITGVEGYMHLVGFILATCIYVPFTVWVADIFWRGVDIPVVRFAKWFETRVSIKGS